MPVMLGGAPVINDAKPGAVLEGKAGFDIVGIRSSLDQLCQIGKLAIAQHLANEARNGAIPGKHNRFGGGLSNNRSAVQRRKRQKRR
jgi:hypothetical protein